MTICSFFKGGTKYLLPFGKQTSICAVASWHLPQQDLRAMLSKCSADVIRALIQCSWKQPWLFIWVASADIGAAACSVSGCWRPVLSVFPSFAECSCDSVTASNWTLYQLHLWLSLERIKIPDLMRTTILTESWEKKKKFCSWLQGGRLVFLGKHSFPTCICTAYRVLLHHVLRPVPVLSDWSTHQLAHGE